MQVISKFKTEKSIGATRYFDINKVLSSRDSAGRTHGEAAFIVVHAARLDNNGFLRYRNK